MDAFALATAATSLLAPFISKLGERVLDNIAEKMPAQMGKLWRMILNRFKDNPAATGASSDLVRNAADRDNQEAFTLQLKKALKEDEHFASQFTDLLKQVHSEANITNVGDGVVANNNSVAVGKISIGGNLSGSVAIGNDKQLNSKPKLTRSDEGEE